MVAAGLEETVPKVGHVSDEFFCSTQDVSYYHRVNNPSAYDWCVVPDSSYDVVLFGGLAVVLACLLQGKLNTLMVLVAGAIIMAIAWPVNLGALGNSLAIWLGISPWQLFFYVFLPPLLLDAAVRIDWYLFRKSVVQVFTLAFLVVGATCVAMIPIMLYILDLRKYGWNWIHACMFGAMIASTDAVAIVSIMKTSGGPRRLRVMLEGESLLNDASGLTLFEIFFHILQVSLEHPEDQGSLASIVGQVFLAIVQFGLIGFVMGMVFGVLTRLFLRYMRYLGASHDQEVALTLGMAYLAYWVTGQPCKGSGVVAVAVMGLYGAATNCWDMSTHAHSHFDGFWETLAFVVNSLVFLYSGASVVNFFIRASGDLTQYGTHSNDLEVTLWMLPIIYIILCLVRFILTMAFRPLFIAIKGDMSFKECIFICVAGLRGSASLIMGSAVVTHELQGAVEESFSVGCWVVKAMMVFWTAGFVLLTLLINAPLLPTVLRLTGLSKVPDKQLARRQRAVAALGEHTATVLEQLRDAEDELLAGVDWAQVAAFVDHGRKYAQFTGQARHKSSKLARMLHKLKRHCCCCLPGSLGHAHGRPAALEPTKGTDGPESPGNQHTHQHKHRDSVHREGFGSPLSTLFSLNKRSTADLECGSLASFPQANGSAVEMTAAVAAPSDGPDHMQEGKLDGICEHAEGIKPTNSSKQQSRPTRRSKERRRNAAGSAEHRRTSGSASDDDSSEQGGSSRSDGSDDGDGWFHNVLPGLGAHEVDVLMQECPFMGASFAAHRAQHAAHHAAVAAADAANNSAACSTAAASGHRSGAGLVSRFWVPRSKKTLLPYSQQQVDPEQQAQQSPQAEAQLSLASQPSAEGSETAAARVHRSGTAGAATPSTAEDLGAESSSVSAARSQSAVLPGMRSLATRSAAPAFVYGGGKATDSSGAGTGDRSTPQHARKGSTGTAYVFDGGPAATGMSKPGSWGLAGMAMDAAAAAGYTGGSRESERSTGSPRALSTAPLQFQTDKALGRQSGMHRGLAARSVVVSGDGRGSDFFADAGQGIAQTQQFPAGNAAASAMHAAHSGEYDAAAAAVDMVSLARSSRRSAQGSAPPAGGGTGAPAASGIGRLGSRGLASRSVGMAGAYQRPGDQAAGAGSLSNSPYQPAGPDSDLLGRFASTCSYPDSSSNPPQPSMRGLATRSQNPHLPVVAAVAPSLYTISTGLNAYAAAGGPSGMRLDSRGREGQRRNTEAGISRNLGAKSVPAAQAAAAMAAAAARGRVGAFPPAAEALRSPDQLATLSSFGPAPAPAVAAAAAAAAAGGNLGKSSGGLMDSVKRGLNKMSVTLGKVSRASRSASAVAGDSSDDETEYDSLYKGSAFASSKGEPAANDEELADARHWLVSGLKRYFHSKRMEGLLSARGLRILDGSCEMALEDARKPLALWHHISRDVGKNVLVRVIIYILFMLRQAAVMLQTVGILGRWLAWPLRLIASMLQRPLNKVLLASVEVAMEYLMGLTASPYVEWLQEGEVWSALVNEIQCESAQVAKFLIDREIEAPERYSAVQSYRVAMAVLRQQRLFVESLFESGMLDSTEQMALAHPVEGAERRLELLGPVWKAPSLREVLRQLPFMRGQPEQVVDFFIRYGHLIMLGNGEQLPTGRDLYVVQAGIVKVTYQPDLGGVQEYFLGAGGVYNLYAGLTGQNLPGSTDAAAQGNVLGKGPVLFCISAKGLRQVSAAAAAGDATFQQLELDMYRLAGLFLLERLKPQLVIEVSQALARMAPLYQMSAQKIPIDASTGGPALPNSSGHRHKRVSRQQRAAWVRQHLTLLKHDLKQQLAKSELLMLPSGCSVAQESHVLLLQGSIQVKVADESVMSDQQTAETARWITNFGRHQHQSILPWLWDIISDEDLRRAPVGVPSQPLPVNITAGPEGATLLICTSASDDSAPAPAAIGGISGVDSRLAPPGHALPTAAARLGPSALTNAAATASEAGAPGLARISGGARGAAAGGAAAAGGVAGAPGPTVARRAVQLVDKQPNPFLRRSLAAAAAADSLMSPRPGSYTRASAAGPAARPAAQPAAAAAAAGGPVSAFATEAAAPNLSRISPTVRELGRVSPLRLGSASPLNGASIDNAQSVGTDRLSNLGDETAAAAAVASMATGDTASGLDGEPLSGDELPSTAGAAAAGDQVASTPAAALQPRRSKSQRPLKPWGSMRTRDM